MDRVEIIELDQATFKYEKGLVEIYRGVADPYSNIVSELSFEANPAAPENPTTNVKFIEADGLAPTT